MVAEGGAVGGAGALLGAVEAERAGGAGVAVAGDVVAAVADGTVAQRVAALAVAIHVASAIGLDFEG